jgi:hypothetical protein
MKRKCNRRKVAGYYGDLAIDSNIVRGVVQDISSGGFKLSHLPDSFQNEKHVYTIIISKGDSHYKLLAKPCWQNKKSEETHLNVGFKVIDAPWEWAELTLN